MMEQLLCSEPPPSWPPAPDEASPEPDEAPVEPLVALESPLAEPLLSPPVAPFKEPALLPPAPALESLLCDELVLSELPCCEGSEAAAAQPVPAPRALASSTIAMM